MFPMFQAEQAKWDGGSGELPKIALPSEEGSQAPRTPARPRKAYVTLDRAIKFGKTIGCRGCDRIAEGVRHSDACHERFRFCLEEESRKATEEAEKKRNDANIKELDEIEERLKAIEAVGMRELDEIEASLDAADVASAPDVPFEAANPTCNHNHTHHQEKVSTNDFWEFDDCKKAWCKVHIRPAKGCLLR